MKKSIFSLLMALLLISDSLVAEPSEWLENDWIKFIDTAVWGTLGDAYSNAGAAAGLGGKFPLVDVYSALSASASAVKPGLQLWLREKMALAYSNENFAQADRYNAFYSCLTWNSCEALREIEQGAQVNSGQQADTSACTEDEKELLRKSKFTPEEIQDHCRPLSTNVSFAGEWKTNWGMMTLGANGSGNYTHDKGKISGSVDGRVLTGTWSESPSYSAPNDAGDVVFTLSDDGTSFTGKWRYGSKGNWKSGWQGTRVE